MSGGDNNQQQEDLLEKLLKQHKFSIFPCVRNKKVPALKGWQQKASNDAQEVSRWFDLEKFNYGVLCGTEHDDLHLTVIDIDNKSGRKGSDSWAQLTQAIEPRRLETYAVQTPSGGFHFYYYTNAKISNSTNIAEGIDVRGAGGFIVGAGSSIDSVSYTVINDRPIAELPSELYAFLQKRKTIPANAGSEAPGHNIPEGSRNDSLFKFAIGLKKRDVDLQNALQMARVFNETSCSPPLDEQEVERTVRSAFGYGANGFGYQVLDPAEAMQFMEQKGYFVASLATENFVWEELKDNHVERYQQISFKNFKNKYPHIEVEVGRTANGQPILKNIGEWWIKNTTSRYDFAFFNPNKDGEYFEGTNKIKNLWEGFRYQPVHHGGLSDSFLGHLKGNVCSDNELLYSYLMDWLSSIIQFPGDKTGRATTVVLQGLHGTGKGFICNMLGKLFGKAYGYVNVDKFSLEQFNGQLENKLFVFFNEVIWSHDRKKANYVKSLITEKVLEINKKYVNSYSSNNYMRFVLATNNFYEGAFVEREDERRFFILDMVPNHRCNKPYFDAIEADLEAGGFEELMHILKNRDISQRNFEKIPVTAAKKGTVINNLDPLDAWICSKAMEGGFRVTDAMGAPCFRCFGKDSVMARELYAAYLAENKAAKGCSSLIGFMMLLKRKLPSLEYFKTHDRNGNGYDLPPIEKVLEDVRETIGVDLSQDLEVPA